MGGKQSKDAILKSQYQGPYACGEWEKDHQEVVRTQGVQAVPRGSGAADGILDSRPDVS